MTVSDKCLKGMHGFCTGDKSSCDCAVCHLGPCVECGADNLQRMYDHGTLCANCKRDRAHAAQATRPPSRCDRCGAPGAFRNPGQRDTVLMCVECHREAGFSLALPGSVGPELVAACKAMPLNDPRHEWTHIRGNRFGCIRCTAQKFDEKLRKAMRSDMLHG